MATIVDPTPIQPTDRFRRLGFSVGLAAAQVLLLSFCSLLLDGGGTFRICTASFIAYWIGVGWILLRRGDRATVTDRRFVRWGWALLQALGFAIACGRVG